MVKKSHECYLRQKVWERCKVPCQLCFKLYARSSIPKHSKVNCKILKLQVQQALPPVIDNHLNSNSIQDTVIASANYDCNNLMNTLIPYLKPLTFNQKIWLMCDLHFLLKKIDLKCVDVTGDGACFYRAIALSVFNDEGRFKDVKKKINSLLTSFKDERLTDEEDIQFLQSFSAFLGNSIINTIIKITSPKRGKTERYADEVEAQTLLIQHIFRRKVLIYKWDRTEQEITPPGDFTTTIAPTRSYDNPTICLVFNGASTTDNESHYCLATPTYTIENQVEG